MLNRLRAHTDNSMASPRKALAVIVAIAAVVAAIAWVAMSKLSDARTHFLLEFAGTNARLQQRIEVEQLEVSIGDAREAVFHGLWSSWLWGLGGFLVIRFAWREFWTSGLPLKIANQVALVPLAAAGVATLEKLVTLAAVRSDGESVRFVPRLGDVVLTLSIIKWILIVALGFLLLATAVSGCATAAQRRRSTSIGMAQIQGMSGTETIRQRTIGQPSRHAVSRVSDSDAPPVEGIGVCCSGGGIRAASYALGALSALERYPDPDGPLSTSVLGSARYLASVSGGGYAAAAWRIAAGTDADLPERPLLGNPENFKAKARLFPSPTHASTDLIEHIRERRVFLATGRGGLPLAILAFLVRTAWHISLILATVYAVAWPFGPLLSRWPLEALVASTTASGRPGVDFMFGQQLWVPPLIMVGVAAALWVLRLAFMPSPKRRVLDMVIATFVGFAAITASVFIALPYLVNLVIDQIPNGVLVKFLSTGIYAAVLGAVWQIGKRYLESRAKYLGGFLLAFALLTFAFFTIEHSALGRGWLSPPWVWASVLVGLALAFVFANPDTWSLHDFYRKRLAGTFAATLTDQGRFRSLTESEAPMLGEYREAGGPQLVLCCAAARDTQSDTGVPALSMTLDSEAVNLYHWKSQEDSQTSDLVKSWITHDHYVERLGKRVASLGSVMGAAAISGAAVAPSMGRQSLKSTDALFAAFNARLGVWVPNPAYPPPESDADTHLMSAPRLVNMFKEVFGIYHSSDPNVYAADGGHWENLGLVELIRRRCKTVISIDASGDIPGTYAAFKDAIALAETECAARVEIDDEAWARLAPSDDGLVQTNAIVGRITYSDGAVGTLLYVKAAVAQSTPVAIRRFAAQDPTFPNYSVGNQMLSDDQMTYLVRLGFSSMSDALTEHRSVVDEALDTETVDLTTSDLTAIGELT